MTRGILIAGNESALYSALAAEALMRVETFASAVIPNRLTLAEGEKRPGAATGAIAGAKGSGAPLPWNPSSPISARTLILAAENRLGRINDAILVCSPPAVYKTAAELKPEEIDTLVSDHIKGWFFLIRELAQYFRRAGSGSLSLAAPENNPVSGGRNAQADLLGPSASSSFRAFAQGVLASSGNEPFNVMGFTGSESGSSEEFAAWLFKIVDENSRKNSCRWLKYSKLRFF